MSNASRLNQAMRNSITMIMPYHICVSFWHVTHHMSHMALCFFHLFPNGDATCHPSRLCFIPTDSTKTSSSAEHRRNTGGLAVVLDGGMAKPSKDEEEPSSRGFRDQRPYLEPPGAARVGTSKLQGVACSYRNSTWFHYLLIGVFETKMIGILYGSTLF